MRRNNIFLELTPLLDVILLILFLVLVQNESRMEVIYAEAMEDFAVSQEAQADEIDDLRQTAAEFDALMLGLEEEPHVIAISLLTDPADGETRTILVEASSQSMEIALSWDGFVRDNAAMTLQTTLAEHVRNADSPVTFVVFRFDSRDIFAADHRFISIAIHNLQLNHPHVFSAELNLG